MVYLVWTIFNLAFGVFFRLLELINKTRFPYIYVFYQIYYNKTDKRESPQEAQPLCENSSFDFIEAVHQW